MGLDTYAAKFDGDREVTNPDERARDFASVPVMVGGMFSGNGEGSFRGKVYDELVQKTTGQTLYQELIPNPIVKGMAASLADYDERGVFEDAEGRAIHALAAWFKVAGDGGYDVVGWW